MGAIAKAWIGLSTVRRFVFSGLSALCITIILYSTGQLQAQEPAVVLLEPRTLALDQGQISSVVVRIEGATDVYGVQLELSFDAGKIKVLDTDEADPGVQIMPGDFLVLEEGFVADNEANNESGQLTYAMALLSPAEPASGAGTLIEFEVEALETGSSDLLLGSVILASPEGILLPVEIVDDPPDDGGIIIPTAAATEPAQATVTTSADSALTATPTAENSQPPTSTAESTRAETQAAASPAVEDSPLPTATEDATAAAAGVIATSTVPLQTPAEEANPTIADPATTEPAKVDPATAIAAAPVEVEEEDAIQDEEMPSPTAVVIGQNRNVDDNQTQAATPAPTANSGGTFEGPVIAIGLILLIVALIAIWFLRRILIGTK